MHPIVTITPQATDTGIHTRTMLVWLQIGAWSARKYDKGASIEITSAHGAASHSARVNKQLLPPDATAYNTLASLLTTIRDEHYRWTLAWSDKGWRLLPTANFQDYSAWYRKRQADFQSALADFLLEYPTLKAHAIGCLNGLYKASDYPDVHDLPGRFTLNVEFSPVPAAGDIRCTMADDQRAMIEASISGRVEQATHTAMSDAWTRLHDVVSKIAERLSNPSAIFRDTLISNAIDVCDALTRLNVTDDPNLEAMRARVEAELTRVSPDLLRDTKGVARQETAEKAQAIMASMAGFYGGGAQ